MVVLFFVKQRTAYEMRISDWSSDVCSSDLSARVSGRAGAGQAEWQAGSWNPSCQRRLASMSAPVQAAVDEAGLRLHHDKCTDRHALYRPPRLPTRSLYPTSLCCRMRFLTSARPPFHRLRSYILFYTRESFSAA